jgi:hypothetical protein
MRFVSDAALVLECEVFIDDGPSSIPCVHATTLHSSEALENVWHSKFHDERITLFLKNSHVLAPLSHKESGLVKEQQVHARKKEGKNAMPQKK